jgi:hypothetical protein
MLEMIQQHTEPETENWNVITPMVGRAREMVKQSKDAAALTIKDWAATTGNGTDGGKGGGAQKAQANVPVATPSQGVKQPSSKKRAVTDNSPGSAPALAPKRVKKLRTRKGDGDNSSTGTHEKGGDNHQKPVVEFEDISAEVEATLREKEERRRRKAEKKRRRESGGSTAASAANEDGEGASPSVWEKPKKKRVKKDTNVVNDVGNGIGEAEKMGESGASEKGKGKEKEKRINGTTIDAEDEDTEVRTKKRRKKD